MSLKRQLLIASLLTLLIPWLGLQFVLELDGALRQQAQGQLLEQAQRMAVQTNPLLQRQPAVFHGTPALFAHTLSHAPNLDGFGDDWPGYDEEFDDSPLDDPNTPLGWQLAVDRDHLYLLVKARRPQPRYFDPGRPRQPHDHLRLVWTRSGERVERLIRTPAPGPVVGWQPQDDPRPDYRIRGFWQAHGNGYQLELQLPRPEPGERFSFAIIQPDRAGVPPSHGPSLTTLPRLVTRAPLLEQALTRGLAPGQQAAILDPAGWRVAWSERPAAPDSPDFDSLSPLQIVERISLNGLRGLVRFYQPSPARWPLLADRQPIEQLPEQGLIDNGDGPALLVSQPLADGRRLVLVQSLDQLLTLSGSALGTVIARSTLLVIALMLVLLGYSSWLSWRITRLQRAVSSSVDQDGRSIAALPPVRGRDEVSELGHQFRLLMDKLQGYTDYLESFSRRLTHELKTPVAIVRSSLDNLAHTSPTADQQAYLDRVRQATERLSQILQGMSEAARLEQSFDHAEHEPFDLAEVATQATHAYQALSPGHRIQYQGPDQGCQFHGSPELLVQLLDKLVDNARDFTPAAGLIEIRLNADPGHWRLAVYNQGSALPDALASEIFNPFVSLRDSKGEGHLGQGLLIVRLIAEHHQGEARASNADDGVEFSILLPRPSQAGHA